MSAYREPDPYTDVYLQFVKGRYGELRLVGATASKPRKPKSGARLVKIKVTLPASSFEPIEPEAEVVFTEDMRDSHVLVAPEEQDDDPEHVEGSFDASGDWRTDGHGGIEE